MSKRIFQYANGDVRDFEKRQYTNAVVLNDGEITEIINHVRRLVRDLRSYQPTDPDWIVTTKIRDEIFKILEAGPCARCGSSGKIMRHQGSTALEACDSCGGTGWRPVEDGRTYTQGDPPAVKAADAFHACLTRGNEMLKLRLNLVGENGQHVNVPCRVTRDKEKFSFESDPIPANMNMITAVIVDQYGNEIWTQRRTIAIQQGECMTLNFDVAGT